ncbi:MAG: 4-alpha-glucanotransferase, partial [Bacteroidales bacterium]|nr:4-alpha-glucanotransferase [Bacteroidales bacterium]
MHLKISIEYFTTPGESLSLVFRDGRTIPMQYILDGIWGIDVQVPASPGSVEYSFILKRDGETVRREWGSHIIPLPSGKKPTTLEVRESWQDRPSDSPFWTKAFSDVIFRRKNTACKRKGNLALLVPAATLRKGEVLAVTGSSPLLGGWKTFIPLDPFQAPLWGIFHDAKEGFEYKYVILDQESGMLKSWETGPNHRVYGIPDDGGLLVIRDRQPAFDSLPWRGAGVAIPVFSLRSEESFGVGEFKDLKKLADWASATGQSVIQILPINDTTMTRTWTDSYPYNANSTFALHPQFISLPDAGVKQTKEYKSLQKELNALPQIDYERVNNEKDRLLRAAFKTVGKKDMDSPAYQSFYSANSHWLIPYAAFCVLRDENGTPEFGKWKEMDVYSDSAVAAFRQTRGEEMDFYCWEQYCLDVQLKDAVAYAHSKGVAIKGDLPIGISRTSVDAWQYPALFNLDSQAGAPPDAFSEDGQNWGFPTYNWEEMAKDGYGWWKARLGKMSEYFDAFRIDHILGFFRIWEIPLGIKSGLLGHFNPALPYSYDELKGRGFNPECGLFVPDPHREGWYHPRISSQNTEDFATLDEGMKNAYNDLYNDFFYRRHNSFWKETAMKKLPALLDSTKMLACGEDLGMIPDCVPDVMSGLNILSLEVQRMPKSPEKTFDEPWTYPYLSVCTTGSHDTSSLRAWWEEDREM